jgi:hypothetical protein
MKHYINLKRPDNQTITFISLLIKNLKKVRFTDQAKDIGLTLMELSNLKRSRIASEAVSNAVKKLLAQHSDIVLPTDARGNVNFDDADKSIQAEAVKFGIYNKVVDDTQYNPNVPELIAEMKQQIAVLKNEIRVVSQRVESVNAKIPKEMAEKNF